MFDIWVENPSEGYIAITFNEHIKRLLNGKIEVLMSGAAARQLVKELTLQFEDKKILEGVESKFFDPHVKLKTKKVKQKLPKLTFRQLEILGMMEDGQEYCALSLTCSLPTLFALVKKGFVTRRDLAGSGAYPHTKIMFKKVA